jgi:NitT/TauT family transport system permease protein
VSNWTLPRPKLPNSGALEVGHAAMPKRIGNRTFESLRVLAYSLAGVVGALLLWQWLTSSQFLSEQFSRGFSPANTFSSLVRMLANGTIRKHAVPSFFRVSIGLFLAAGIGIPLGIAVGHFRRMHLLTNTVFQFIRMTSPLAWMPLAIIMLGVGNKPVCFLITVGAVWPIVINTAHGVRNVDELWIKVVRMLGGGQWQVLRRAVIPAIIPDVLTGLRISLGISWIILVPAEMLGVSSGLGYFILDTRDRFDYGELMATILVVGFLGFLSDTLIRMAQGMLTWRPESFSVSS